MSYDDTERMFTPARTISGLRRRTVTVTDLARRQRLNNEVDRILDEVATEWRRAQTTRTYTAVDIQPKRRRRWWPTRG